MRVWVDCTAAAHPLVLRPLIDRFGERGDDVWVTSRAYGQTLEILERLGIPYEAVGAHGGASWARKGLALAGRSARLARLARRRRPDLALAHGSVDLAVVSAVLRIPSAQMQDYEFAGLQRRIAFRAARRVLMPDAIPVERLARIGAPEEKLFRYPGLKEDYYLSDDDLNAGILDELGLDPGRVIVVVRPPPETSAYHAPNSLYSQVIDRLRAEENVTAVVIPRTGTQRAELERLATGDQRLIVPGQAIDAQSLIAHADLVVSAGGTMNREAVALGTPVYTTFAGRMGGVDEALIAAGRLQVLESASDIVLKKRDAPVGVLHPRDPKLLLGGVLRAVEAVG